MFLSPFFPLGNTGPFWTHSELCSLPLSFPEDDYFCESSEHRNPDVVKAFGTSSPPGTFFLLHHGPSNQKRGYPVILVHGAGTDASCWTWEGPGLTGLAWQLWRRGFWVFGITFSHPHGDNRIQGRQLAAACEKVCQITGSPRVDIVAHSKGGIACRAWLQGMVEGVSCDAVRRVCFLGVPNLGLDFIFRYPLLALSAWSLGFSMPIPYVQLNVGLSKVDTQKHSPYRGGAFKGQGQMLRDWSKDYPLEPGDWEALTVYRGGQTMIGCSLGIEEAIKDGEDFVSRLAEKPFVNPVEVALMAGSTSFWLLGEGATAVLGDGLVLPESALESGIFEKSGCKILGKELFPVHHFEMLYLPLVADWVTEMLRLN